MTPKRKPLMVETPRSASKESDDNNPSASTSSNAAGRPPTRQHQFPPPHHHPAYADYRRSGGEDVFSPYRPHHSVTEGSMLPPHRSRMDYHPYNSHHHSPQKTKQQQQDHSPEKSSRNSQSIHREPSSSSSPSTTTAGGTGPDPAATAATERLPPAHSMEEDMGVDYLSLNEPVGSFAEEYSPPRHNRRSPSKLDESKRTRGSPYAPYQGFAPPNGHHHHHPPPPPPFYAKSPRGSSLPPHPYPPMYFPPHKAGGAGGPPPPNSHPGHPSRRGGDMGGPPPPHHHHPHHHPPYSYPPPNHAGFPPPHPRYYQPFMTAAHNHNDHNPHASLQNNNPWTSPQAFEPEPYGDDDDNNNNNAKDAFRGSPSRAASSPPRPSPPPPDREEEEPDTTNTTPEKVVQTMRSPFRSPPLSQTKKSPMFHGSPAGLGGYGSFGMMDTPGGTLAAEFSPMGPMLNNPFATGFGEHPTPPQLSLSRSSSDDDMPVPVMGATAETAPDRSPDDNENEDDDHEEEEDNDDDDDDNEDAVADPPMATSPFSGFIKNFHHFPSASKSSSTESSSKSVVNGACGGLQGVTRSPLRSERRSTLASESRSGRKPVQLSLSTSQATGSGGKPPTRPPASTILASPMGHSSSAKPRKLWHGTEQPGPVRLELGSSSLQQKSLEGINSMMRGQTGPPPLSTPASHAFSRAPPPPPGASYRRLNTPIKLEPSPIQGKSGPGSLNNKRPMTLSDVKSAREGKVARSTGKENVSTPKRSPCNCKKSRCLKLYCECFAAELYCDGCNCTDCQNTSAFSKIRDKAMKDTRAKNPNAFKPRISVKGPIIVAGATSQSGHNMGCRCKRSECLKKYCECFQAGVMCGSKCKCVECMNYAGSQKLIDKRRKIKDQRGAELAMKVAEQTWKGPQHSGRKLPIARPAVHGMRPMPSPVATPGGRHPMALPHMMHPSPGHPGPPHYMRPMMMGHPHMGYSPMGMHPHVSPSAYGMYPPHHPPPPSHTPASTKKLSPSASATKQLAEAKAMYDRSEMPYTKTVSAKKSTPSKRAPKKSSPLKNVSKIAAKLEDVVESENVEAANVSPTNTDTGNNDKKSPAVSECSPPGNEKGAGLKDSPAASCARPDPPVQPSPSERPDSSVQPTPAETKKPAPAKITPMPATPAPAVRLAYDPSTQKKCKVGDAPEVTFAFFGTDLPKQPKTVVLNIFSFLSDYDLKIKAGLVCKRWHLMSKDEALWKPSHS